jgi:hypothetical protein
MRTFATIQGQGTNSQPRVSCLLRPIKDGDFKDPPLKYSVIGPGNEVQNFSTLRWANIYASVRRRSRDQVEAGRKFSQKV